MEALNNLGLAHFVTFSKTASDPRPTRKPTTTKRTKQKDCQSVSTVFIRFGLLLYTVARRTLRR